MPEPRTSRPDPAAALHVALALDLLLLAGAVLAGLLGATTVGGVLAGVALLLLVLLGQPRCGRRERALLAAALGLSLFAWLHLDDPGPALAAALDRGAFLAAFILLLGLLREAAQSSPTVRACGAWLTGQPPGRRYLALHLGGHGLGVLLNFGVLSLLAPMVQRGVAAATERDGRPDLAPVREQRQISALLRGFAWILVWSPTTIVQGLLATTLPGVQTSRLMAVGLGLAATMLLAGWAEDRLRWRTLRARELARGRPRTPVPAPRGALARMAGICLLLVAVVLAVRSLLSLATVPALMVSVPVFACVWVFVQQVGRAAAAGMPGLRRRGREILLQGVPAGTPEIVTLASAAYTGTLAAALVPPSAVAAAVTLAGGEPLILLAGLMLAVVVLAQLALTPIMVVVFLATALSGLEPMPVDPTLAALALAGGWAVALGSSPFTAAALILSRVTAIDARRIAWAWNGVYGLLGIATVLLCLALALAAF